MWVVGVGTVVASALSTALVLLLPVDLMAGSRTWSGSVCWA
jgi:hypothetical protein